mgnify:CR=1 FL=1
MFVIDSILDHILIDTLIFQFMIISLDMLNHNIMLHLQMLILNYNHMVFFYLVIFARSTLCYFLLIYLLIRGCELDFSSLLLLILNRMCLRALGQWWTGNLGLSCLLYLLRTIICSLFSSIPSEQSLIIFLSHSLGSMFSLI